MSRPTFSLTVTFEPVLLLSIGYELADIFAFQISHTNQLPPAPHSVSSGKRLCRNDKVWPGILLFSLSDALNWAWFVNVGGVVSKFRALCAHLVTVSPPLEPF